MKTAACCAKDKSVADDITKILIFGSTGLIGRAVAMSAVASPFMKVYGFTRQSDIDEGQTGNNIKGVEYFIGNMLDYESVLRATKNIDVIFFGTNYWENMNSKTEYYQGRNVVNAAVQNGVKHIIYSGTDFNTIHGNDSPCPCFEAKARIADFIIYIGIPYTIVRFSWFYENFLSVFRPHPTSLTEFALPLPMGNRGLNMGSIKDFAKCITLIALRPAKTIHRTIDLATTYLTVADIARIMNDNFPDLQFYDPQITLSEYRRLAFWGAEELAAMFQHYQHQRRWDNKPMIEYGYSAVAFEDWVSKSKHEIQHILDEQLDELEEEDLLVITSRTKELEGKNGRRKQESKDGRLDILKPLRDLKLPDSVGKMLDTIKETQILPQTNLLKPITDLKMPDTIGKMIGTIKESQV